MAVSSMVENN